ncbi:hypothetical protein TIFTF001_034962 [Ficus carica]|uniref:Uncharacterized protein n=1 Tax=Ficus carica TaxID=3494 RepID=A0AA88E139_FICCA|nr:hypothetical protein TIFTF001_034962 [Ficus carica]
MKGLSLLDLSETSIEKISESVNLTALLFRGCRKFTCVPSLAKLTALKRLNFYKSGIKEIPQALTQMLDLWLMVDAPITLVRFDERGKAVNLTKSDLRKSVASGGDCPVLLSQDIETLGIQTCCIDHLNKLERVLFVCVFIKHHSSSSNSCLCKQLVEIISTTSDHDGKQEERRRKSYRWK